MAADVGYWEENVGKEDELQGKSFSHTGEIRTRAGNLVSAGRLNHSATVATDCEP